MGEFEDQIRNAQLRKIQEFNTNPQFEAVRAIYKNNFDDVYLFIKRTNPRTAIEDIANLDQNLKKLIVENMLFFQEINRAIVEGTLSVNDIQ